MSAPGGLAERIDGAWTTLSPQEQRVAGFLRSRPDESALYNSSELARRTGVSKATVSRLFRRLGFAGSQEARELLRAQRSAGLPVVVSAEGDRLAAQIATDGDHLRALEAGLDRAVLRQAAVALAAAPRIVVIGLRSGFPIAMLLRQALAQVRPDVLLAPAPGQTLGEELAGITAEDVVVLVGFRRRPAAFASMLAGLSRTAAHVLLIADPSLRMPGHRLRFDVAIESTSPFDSYAAAASLISLLAGEVLLALGPAGAARVAAIDRAYAELGELEV
ncbi:MAG: MurR/RpiR family transcriptional regulator [Acidobacteria bacterium]|nr:MurR/RpiR family transcriptional regulator [Acidobacteriota bacterium]